MVYGPFLKYWNGKAGSIVFDTRQRHSGLGSKDEHETTERNFSFRFLVFTCRRVKQLQTRHLFV